MAKWYEKLGSGISDIGSGVIDYFSPRDEIRAINAQIEAQQKANEEARRFTEQGYQQATELQQPYAQAGQEVFTDLLSQLRAGRFNAPEPPQIENFAGLTQKFMTQDPGEEFRRREAMKAIEQSAAARGTRLGTSALNALTQRASDLASQEYGARYARASQAAGQQIAQQQNRYDQIRQNLADYYNRLQGFANLGPQTATSLANQRLGLAGQQAGFSQQAGNIQAAGIGGKQEARNAAMQNIANLAATGAGYALGGAPGAVAGNQLSNATAPRMSTQPFADQMYGQPRIGNYYQQYGDFNAGVPSQPMGGIGDYSKMGDQLANVWRLGYEEL